MKEKILLYIFSVLLLVNTGCDSFLDVKPKSSIAEDDIFSSEIGFQQAITGIYASMADRPLYGDQLSMGFVSAMAQNYATTANGFIFIESAGLNFDKDEVKKISEGIWQGSYNAIAGLNNILAHIDDSGATFTGDNHALIKGEALALRAYLHFELLRLYAVSFGQGADALAISYRTVMNANPEKPETVTGFLALALKDLEKAEKLLANVDPILKGNRDRRFSMNFLAVKGLQARVNLYAGNKEQAAKDAQYVINSGLLKFVTNAQISTTAAGKDRLFSNEQIFSLRVLKMKDWTETGSAAYFRYTTSLSNNSLKRTAANYQTLYETATGGSTDYRYVYLIENDGGTVYPSKFWQTWNGGTTAIYTARLDQTVPLMRLSEMYYIAAETASSPEAGITTLNTVRANRGLGTLKVEGATDVFLTNEITKEYQKEFYAEGQLFFYYKRLNFGRMQFGSKNLTKDSYILPIPDSETEFNPVYDTSK
ncbi:RagB/SusD family nutrient uptake outer membrane protein [Sphingobacterium tabacisoli]|uniref:RagB/SusD family nutrient uptake outer membrane protein n=1 Tax=Sphingobacterium tabacisoli TaxID=2044855 RepID=A0ABW5KZR0_9SPHI|nr:RagB/SusD family nutrient uptake outer membrane protein [Sphingobacterium tabacisoli]